MKRWMWTGVLLAGATWLVACGDGSTGNSGQCEPGAKVTCTCTLGDSGVAECSADRVWGNCQCSGGVNWSDVSPADTGAADTGGAQDTAAADTAPADAGRAVDTGSWVDTNVPDTNVADTGLSDVGADGLQPPDGLAPPDSGPSPDGGGAFNADPCWDSKCPAETAACAADVVCTQFTQCLKSGKDAATCTQQLQLDQAKVDALNKLLTPLQECGWKACSDPNAGTCKDNCGTYFGGAAKCNCDADCKKYGDCCADYDQLCGGAAGGSCAGKCGTYDQSASCQCDSGCQSANDCCADYQQLCSNPDAGGTTDGGSSDTGSSDTGAADTGSSDTGAADTGSSDTGAADTGSSDTGAADTGSSDTGSSDTGVADTGSSDTSTSDTGSADAGGGCDCVNVECGFKAGCAKSCGACAADKQCVANKCEAKPAAGLAKFGEYCGPTKTCAPPPAGAASTSPEAVAYQTCLNAQCDTKLCYANVCTKTCKLGADLKDNATGAAGADGIEDTNGGGDCANAASGAKAVHGSNYSCVEQATAAQQQQGNSSAVCLPSGSWKQCKSDAECGAQEACRLYFVTGALTSRCGPKSKSPDASAGAKLTELCDKASPVDKPAICSNDLCFSIGCSAMCTKDADCVSKPGACQAGKCPNGETCTSDVDCSAWKCEAMQLSSADATKYNVCWPKGGCKTNGDCPDAALACRLNYNGVSKAAGDPDPNNPGKLVMPAWDNLCVSKAADGVKSGQQCDPYDADQDKSLKPCENPLMCNNGYCSSLCETGKDCPADSKCSFEEAPLDLDNPKDGEYDVSLAYGACSSTKGSNGKGCMGSKECGAGKHCKVFVEPSPANAPYKYVSEGLCVDKVSGQGDYGALCGSASTGVGLQKVCNSSYCLNTTNSAGQAQAGFCVDLCGGKDDCAQNVSIYSTSYKSVCTSLRLAWNTTVDPEDDHYVPVCVPTSAKSSLTDCSQTKLCSQSDQACIGYPISMSVHKASKLEYLCGYIGNEASATNPNPGQPTKLVGQECALEGALNECAHGYCLPDVATGKGYCSRVCNGNADCGAGDGMMCNLEYQRIPRPTKANAAVMPLCMKAKSCIPCASDNSCAGNYACTNIGAAGTQAKKVCSPTCSSDADCVGKDGGSKCVDVVGEDGKAVAGAGKVCAASCSTPTGGGANSCKGKCGNPYDGNAPCQCDSQCSQFSDCCSDYQQECGP